MMANWNKYKNSDGEWAEVGAFILEASVNGSWVVRHKTAAVPCRVSADVGEAQPGGLDGAKASCERVLAEVLAAGPDRGEDVAVALCRRYVAMRDLQRTTDSAVAMHAAAANLDERVAKYLASINKP
jgi:hypothetical protein